MHEDGGKGSNLKESSPPRPKLGGVEKELPTLFQRLERYPIWELDMELEREPSWDSWERAGSMRLTPQGAEAPKQSLSKSHKVSAGLWF